MRVYRNNGLRKDNVKKCCKMYNCMWKSVSLAEMVLFEYSVRRRRQKK